MRGRGKDGAAPAAPGDFTQRPGSVSLGRIRRTSRQLRTRPRLTLNDPLWPVARSRETPRGRPKSPPDMRSPTSRGVASERIFALESFRPTLGELSQESARCSEPLDVLGA